MKKALILSVISLLFSTSVNSALLNWSWSFTQSLLAFDARVDSNGQYINNYDGFVYLTVKNDISSTESIDLTRSGFDLSDGTFGWFGQYSDSAGKTVVVTTYCCSDSIQDTVLGPGEETTFTLFYLNPAHVSDELMEIDPLFYVTSYDPSVSIYDLSSGAKFSNAPLYFSYSPVPIPPSFFLFSSGLAFLLRYKKTNVNKFQVS